VTASKEKQRLIQDLKTQGFSRGEVEKALGLSKTTVARLWQDDKDTEWL
jgi:DNA invertase Pin-like site-specific DNA recombinase